MPTKSYKRVKMLGFRLPANELKTLIERAEALRMSPHHLARHYVMERLGQAEKQDDTMECLGMLRDDVHAARTDVALATLATLQFGGKASKEEAEKFLRDKLGFSLSERAQKSKGGDSET